MKDHISAVQPRTLPKPAGFSYGYEVTRGRLVFVAGQVARDEQNAVVGKGDIVTQFRQVCRNIQTVLSAAGGDLSDVVKLTIYVLDVDDYKRHLREIGGVYREYFGKHFPAMTLVEVAALLEDGAKVEIEATAVLPAG